MFEVEKVKLNFLSPKSQIEFRGGGGGGGGVCVNIIPKQNFLSQKVKLPLGVVVVSEHQSTIPQENLMFKV